MITEKNSSYLLIGNVSRGAATKVQDLPKGAVAIVNANTGDIITNPVTENQLLKVVMKTKTGAVTESPIFTLKDVKSSSALETTSLDIQQISFLGATDVDSVTGMGTIELNKVYTVHISIQNLDVTHPAPLIKFGAYKATTTSQFDMVTGLKDSFDRQVNSPFPIIAVDRVSNGTRVALNGNVSVTSKFNVATLSTGNAPLPGSIVKFKGVAYKVVNSIGSSMTLDKPYTGVTETILSTDTNTGEYSNATLWGLRFTGIRPNFDIYTDSTETQLISFNIFSEDLEVTEYKHTKATSSVTDGARISYKEKYAQFLTRPAVVSDNPITRLQSEADPDKMYKLYILNIENKVPGSIAIGVEYIAATSITIALESTLNENIKTILGIN